MKKGKHILLFILAFVLVVVITLYYINSDFNDFVKLSIKMLLNLDIEGLTAYIRSFGIYAALISFTLMLMQAIIPPLPASIITLANAAVFGASLGGLLSFVSLLAGATFCFSISRILGRDVAVKFTGEKALKKLDDFFLKYGKYAILIARLFPFISFDLVSYATGLTSIPFLTFIAATAIGQTPSVLVYSYAGSSILGGPKMALIGFGVLVAFSMLVFAGKRYYDKKNKNNTNK